jgi:hypothetical protein
LTRTKDGPGEKIDRIMEDASKALTGRRYFEAERLCVEAMEAAHTAADYERMARICLPLQESRRLKRQLASDAGNFFVMDDQLPKPQSLQAGCYLVRPPRVGLDGRMLREMADQQEVPVIVVTREPTTRLGQWPVVALGPVTIRAYVDPPVPQPKKKGKEKLAVATRHEADSPETAIPPVEWFLAACEALGDAAIDSVDPARPPAARVEEFWLRVQAHPDHEKLHQRLADACMDALRAGPAAMPREIDELDEDLAEEDLDGECEGEEEPRKRSRRGREAEDQDESID